MPAGARQFASEHVPEALQVLVELMRNAKSEKARLDAAMTLLALAGVRPADSIEEKSAEGEKTERPAVLLNLFLGGSQEPIQVIDGEAREITMEKPVRLAGEAVRALSKPGSEK